MPIKTVGTPYFGVVSVGPSIPPVPQYRKKFLLWHSAKQSASVISGSLNSASPLLLWSQNIPSLSFVLRRGCAGRSESCVIPLLLLSFRWQISSSTKSWLIEMVDNRSSARFWWGTKGAESCRRWNCQSMRYAEARFGPYKYPSFTKDTSTPRHPLTPLFATLASQGSRKTFLRDSRKAWCIWNHHDIYSTFPQHSRRTSFPRRPFRSLRHIKDILDITWCWTLKPQAPNIQRSSNEARDWWSRVKGAAV